VPRRDLTRRQALRLGAGAAALAVLQRPAAALAARPALFELPLPGAHGAVAAGWRTTGVLRAPRRFDLVGLHWAHGGRLEAEVRARPRGGAWTPWVGLHPLGDHAPDGERAPAGTEPAFTGTADEVQLRLRGAARDVRLRFVRALPTASAARRLAARAAGRRSARAAARAQGTVGAPPIITRDFWGADSVPPRTTPAYGTVQAAFVHHTVTANTYTPAQSAAIVLGIARYHRDSNGWNDIGYNFLVDRYGQVFEGRAGGIDAAVIGAQAQGYNAQSTGIACLGTFESVAQTEAGMEALAHLVGWKLSLHGIPVQGTVTLVSAGGASNRYGAGTPVTLQRIAGHRDGDATSCPGSALYAQLADLRVRAERYTGPVAGVTVRASAAQRGTAPVAISGTLRFADGSSPYGAPLTVEYTVAGGAWAPVASTTCGADGAWNASVALPASGTVRAVFAGDATRPRLESAGIAVTVVPRLIMGTSRTRARARRAIAVSGALSPAQANVACVLEHKVRGHWRIEQRKTVRVRRGRYRTEIRPKRSGTYRVWIVAAGANRSRVLRITR
jgi:N-acetylmuramoyl-L-alanine amidase-like protein